MQYNNADDDDDDDDDGDDDDGGGYISMTAGRCSQSIAIAVCQAGCVPCQHERGQLPQEA
jgi:hypothetical protein